MGKTYNVPNIEVAELAVSLLSASGPGATDIGAPSVSNGKSVWDEEESETYYNNIKEEQSYEDWN